MNAANNASESSLLSKTLQTTVIKSARKPQNVSKEKLTFLDSTAVTQRLFQNTTSTADLKNTKINEVSLINCP